MLAGRRDLAVLWDLRVCPRVAGRAWAGRSSGGPCLSARAWLYPTEIETRNTNVSRLPLLRGAGRPVGRRASLAYPRRPPVAHETS